MIGKWFYVLADIRTALVYQATLWCILQIAPKLLADCDVKHLYNILWCAIRTVLICLNLKIISAHAYGKEDQKQIHIVNWYKFNLSLFWQNVEQFYNNMQLYAF